MNTAKEQEELGTPITQEEMTANYNAWWDSLTNEDKEKLYKEQEEAESQYINSIPPENL